MQLARSDANLMAKNNLAPLEEGPLAVPEAIEEKKAEWFGQYILLELVQRKINDNGFILK